MPGCVRRAHDSVPGMKGRQKGVQVIGNTSSSNAGALPCVPYKSRLPSKYLHHLKNMLITKHML